MQCSRSEIGLLHQADEAQRLSAVRIEMGQAHALWRARRRWWSREKDRERKRVVRGRQEKRSTETGTNGRILDACGFGGGG